MRIDDVFKLKKVVENNSLYIYGAGTICKLIMKLLRDDAINADIKGILVTSVKDNDIVHSFHNIPIFEYDDSYKNENILMALSPLHLQEVMNHITFGLNVHFLSEDMEEKLNERLNEINNRNALSYRVKLEKEIIEKGKKCNKTDVDIMLLTPPYWDIYSPFSATACLSASLKRDGITVFQNDIGIQCFHNAIKNKYKDISEKFMSKNYYNDIVKKYEKNNYLTYEEYRQALWFFDKDYFDFNKVKKKYFSMSNVQKRVIDEFYMRINAIDTIDMNFDDNKHTIDDNMKKNAFINLLETLLSDSLETIYEKKPKILGFSVTSSFQFLTACEIAKLFREFLPDTQFLFGGSCADLFVRSAYKNKLEIYKYFDYILIGEGETALKELLRYTGHKTNIDKVPNLVHIKDDNSITIDEVVIEDVISLPTPDYDDLDLSLYMAPELILPYQSSRGCHYGYCAFCNHDEKYRHNYRSKQMEQVVKDILKLHYRYKANYFQFVDEAIRPDCFKLMIDEMDKHEEFKKIKWFYYSRVSMQYDLQTVIKAKKNGCSMVMFGIETFNQRLLNFIKKGINVETSRYCLKLFHENGIKTYAWLMSALPSETMDDAEKDFMDLKKEIKNIDAFSIGSFFLSKNTDMYMSPSKYNITRINDDDPYDFDSHYEGEKIDRRKIMDFVKYKYAIYQIRRHMYDNRYTVFFE